ncbi:MAG: DUF106 domain-containing protein [Candidatus Micrarchaeota archaeon]|nr:DUF106 domain-containing protein [Candidatus Micrarchaeota archaeon]MDE1847429.1 DUF106 domain-containing protein [Candidatus Micrarchaeota archaeon]MDE1864076.1 DUF106 domain-containing protein [Candidatus Micrarchaeota archaeon]
MQTIIIEIIILGAIYALFSVFVQQKLLSGKYWELQNSINVKSKELMELSKTPSPNKEELAAKQKEVMSMASQSMKYSLKPMFVIFPLFIIVYYYALPAAFAVSAAALVLPFGLSYKTLFIVVSFIIGFVLSMIFTTRNKKKAAAKAQPQAESSPQPKLQQ